MLDRSQLSEMYYRMKLIHRMRFPALRVEHDKITSIA